MLNCPWEKRYKETIRREELPAANFRPMYGPDGASPNIHAERIKTARDNLHKLALDHRLGGCTCQAQRRPKFFR